MKVPGIAPGEGTMAALSLECITAVRAGSQNLFKCLDDRGADKPHFDFTGRDIGNDRIGNGHILTCNYLPICKIGHNVHVIHALEVTQRKVIVIESLELD